ncbi:MAG: PEP/pyruvate-binding domain-containing protein [Deltaproteobacteria bacterium]
MNASVQNGRSLESRRRAAPGDDASADAGTPASGPGRLRGGKAAVLLELREAGFRIPDFLVSPADPAAAVGALGFPLVVRSSASVEDGRDASFAGQFRSFLGLGSLEQVEDAIVRCRESARLPSVAGYCRRQGIDPSSIRMDVIVQRMIEPELAGVAFTVNPVTGADEVVIEACAGLADGLLAGQAPPLPAGHPLLARYAGEIAGAARRIMRHFGAPQDVEFAVAGGLVYILQSRPVTRIGFAPDVGEWTTADFRDGGVSSRVCSPLMWSLYDFIWESSLKGSLAQLKLLDRSADGGDFQAGRMFFGRPYWNLGAVKRCLLKLPGFVEREFDTDLSVEINYARDGRTTPLTLWGALRALPAVLAVRGFFREREREARALLNGEFDAIERRCEQPPDDVVAAFRTLIERDYFRVEGAYFRTVFAVSLAKLDFKMSFPEADYASLAAALPGLRHMAPLRAIAEMRNRGERDVAGLVREFRHHSRRGIDVREPRWDEDREFVAALFQNPPGPAGPDPRPAYETARAAALSRLPRWKRRGFERRLDRLRMFVWLREEMRDLSNRMYYFIRRGALEIARRRQIGEDIFFMTFREIFADDRSQVERNREIFDSYRNFAAPNEIGSRYVYRDGPPPAGALRGIGASPGSARGIARAARSVEEALAADAGSILICPFTDPGWTPVLARVTGVVTETGGLLSHAAVICREFGIPAVLGVPHALQRIGDGREIVVDGNAGSIHFVEEALRSASPGP